MRMRVKQPANPVLVEKIAVKTLCMFLWPPLQWWASAIMFCCFLLSLPELGGCLAYHHQTMVTKMYKIGSQIWAPSHKICSPKI